VICDPTLEEIVSDPLIEMLAIGRLASPSLLRETLKTIAVFPPSEGIENSL
jgi:hypothetical protein